MNATRKMAAILMLLALLIFKYIPSHVVLPSKLFVGQSHSMHKRLLELSLYVPSGQGVQVGLSVELLKVPGGHAVQFNGCPDDPVPQLGVFVGADDVGVDEGILVDGTCVA